MFFVSQTNLMEVRARSHEVATLEAEVARVEQAHGDDDALEQLCEGFTFLLLVYCLCNIVKYQTHFAEVRETHNALLSKHSENIERLKSAASTRKDADTKTTKLEAWLETAQRSCDAHLPNDAGVALLQEQVQVFERLKEEGATQQVVMSEIASAFERIGADPDENLQERLDKYITSASFSVISR